VNIELEKCNNIESGKITIVDGALNIKYAINGTGKSTVAKAIEAFVHNDDAKIKELVPFKFRNDVENNLPSLKGIENINTIAVFNEEYINQYIFQENELIKDSFEIFVKSPDYERHLAEIEHLLSDINSVFQKQPELDDLIQTFTQFIDGFGKAKSGYSAAGAIGKGLAKGNKIDNIPSGLEVYTPYLKNESNVKWLKWQLEGKAYLDMAEQCPYCAASIETTKDTILKVSEEFDANSILQLNKMLDVFNILMPYFSKDTAKKIEDITKNVSGITDHQKNYLIEIKTQVETLLRQLHALKNIGFNSLKNVEKIADELQKYKLDISYYSHLRSDISKEKTDIINQSLDLVLQKAGLLQGEIAKQKITIKKTIEKYSDQINYFLKYAGYKYYVTIEEPEDASYRLMLKHIDASDSTIESVRNHLSFGERNAFALVLFMYEALKMNPDLIVLDDPISSFGGNKKFAIINMLFMGEKSLKNRTVLLLTHEFSTVIDIIYNMPYNFSPAPKAKFLSTVNGTLSEKEIVKCDIQSYSEIAKINIESNMNIFSKLIYLRRLLEIENPRGLGWQLLSNIFHKRVVPEYHFIDEKPNRLMFEEEVLAANEEIKKYIPDFDYETEYQKTQNNAVLKALYDDSRSNYEKLQIYRIMFNEKHANKIVQKFINECFHIENDLLFQLNPCEYDTIPQYIINECDEVLNA
jgi:ABC-type dipeptide/oligopeptide/nickel transport system ATPase subunit